MQTPLSIGCVNFHDNEHIFALKTDQQINLQRLTEFLNNWLQHIEEKALNTDQTRVLKPKTNFPELKSTQRKGKNGRAINNKKSAKKKTNKQLYKERVTKSVIKSGEGSDETGRIGITGLRQQSDNRNSPQLLLDLTGVSSRASTSSLSSSYTTPRPSTSSSPDPTLSRPESSTNGGLVLQHLNLPGPSQIRSANPPDIYNSVSHPPGDQGGNVCSPRTRLENNGNFSTALSQSINEFPTSASEAALHTTSSLISTKSIDISTVTNQDEGANQASATLNQEIPSHQQPTSETDNSYKEIRASTGQPPNEALANERSEKLIEREREMHNGSFNDSASRYSFRHAALALVSLRGQLTSSSVAAPHLESSGYSQDTPAPDISRKRKAFSPHAVETFRPAPALSSASSNYKNRSCPSAYNVWCYLARVSV